ncbi:hypothetical protein B0H13DRAFT_2006067 [Mycena leptocephala]|nr:hypothetical protein B0H13DRAFT_2006067 [Mycena leptocephala]
MRQWRRRRRRAPPLLRPLLGHRNLRLIGRPAWVSAPARPWVGRERARGRLAGTKGGGSAFVYSALPVRLGSRRISAHTAAVVDAGVGGRRADGGGTLAQAGADIDSGGGGVRALGRLWGRTGAGGRTAAEYVFVGGVAFGAGLAGAQRSILVDPSKTRRDETKT